MARVPRPSSTCTVQCSSVTVVHIMSMTRTYVCMCARTVCARACDAPARGARWVTGHSGERKDDPGEQVVAYETTLELGGVFKEEVTTALPYMERLFEPFESSRSMENPAVSVPMLTEDAVVLVGEVSL